MQYFKDHGAPPLTIWGALLESAIADYKGDEPQLDDVTITGFTIPHCEKRRDTPSE